MPSRQALLTSCDTKPKLFLHAHDRRLVYMDSDVVLQGDVALLAKLDMEGHPVAAVEDCSQHFASRLQDIAQC